MASSILSGSLAAQVQTGLLQSGEDRAINQLKEQQTANSDARIDKSATEFESMLLSTWLSEAEQSMASVPGAEDEDDGTTGRDQMMSLGVQSLSTALASTGGIGIGKMIAHALHAAADSQQPAENVAKEQVTSQAASSVGAKKIAK